MIGRHIILNMIAREIYAYFHENAPLTVIFGHDIPRIRVHLNFLALQSSCSSHSIPFSANSGQVQRDVGDFSAFWQRVGRVQGGSQARPRQIPGAPDGDLSLARRERAVARARGDAREPSRTR